MYPLIDFHCHLDLIKNHDDLIADIKKSEAYVLSVTTTPKAWKMTSNLALGCPRIKTAIGLHPQLIKERHTELPLFEYFLKDTKYVGEVGIDGSKEFKDSVSLQESVFDSILKMCVKNGGRILSIHSRGACHDRKVRVIYMTPQGEVFSQQKAVELAKEEDLIFLCGHYEGIDERVLEEIVTDYISIGDYVLTGGELPAMVMIDTISRLVPGVLNNGESAQTESHSDGLLEYPQYSRPEVWHEKTVPDVLLSGHHANIEKWRHEQALLAMLDEERLQFVGSMVLGMNDALVELTGTLAGLTFALQNNRLVALSGLITGVSATFSMTASAYLSAKSDNDPQAVKSCLYTGVMYMITVALMSLPYLLLPAEAYIPALIALLVTVTLIILVFYYYISVAKDYNFKQRFGNYRM